MLQVANIQVHGGWADALLSQPLAATMPIMAGPQLAIEQHTAVVFQSPSHKLRCAAL